MKDGRVDVVFVVGPATSEVVTDVVSAATHVSGGVIFVPIAEAKAIAQRLPALESIDIVRGTFGGKPPRPASLLKRLAFRPC